MNRVRRRIRDGGSRCCAPKAAAVGYTFIMAKAHVDPAELLDDFFVRGIDFGISQGAFGVTIRERVSHALLAGGDVLAVKYVEQLDAFQVRGLQLLYRVQHRVVGQ